MNTMTKKLLISALVLGLSGGAYAQPGGGAGMGSAGEGGNGATDAGSGAAGKGGPAMQMNGKRHGRRK